MHDCKSRHEALDPLDVVNVESDLFLKSVELFVHLDLKIVAASLDLCLKLQHFLLLC